MRRWFALAAVLTLASPPAMAQSPEQVRKELKEVGDKLTQAMIKRDVAVLEMHLADDYSFTDPMGTVTTKKEEMEQVKSGDLKIESIEDSDVKVRVLGEGSAIVTGLSKLKGKWKDEDISGDYRFLSVYVKKEGRWQAVAEQVTAVPKAQ